MSRAKVVYLDEYRKSKHYRNVLGIIERHLEEAGLLLKYSSVCSSRTQGGEEYRPPFDTIDSGACSK